MASIEWHEVTFHYPGADTPALSAVNLQVGSGEFVVLSGPSGSGKSTLLRLLKREVAPGGRMAGQIRLDGVHIAELPAREAAAAVGLVMQHPDNQMVADTVLHELAFGMENFGMPQNLMHRRMAEVAGFFGLEPLLDRRTDELSGGQKMTVNLAAVLMLQPKVLLLDEPLAQLDPLAARELLGMVKRLNEEWGITVLVSEHRLDDLLPMADRVIRLEAGAVRFFGSPRSFAANAWRRRETDWIEMLPSVTRWAMDCRAQGEAHPVTGSSGTSPGSFPKADGDEPDPAFPLTVKEAGQQLLAAGNAFPLAGVSGAAFRSGAGGPKPGQQARIPLLAAEGLVFAYDKHLPAVMRGLTWHIRQGDRIALFGGNGSGKSTLLQLLGGLHQPQRGDIRLGGVQLSRLAAQVRYARIGYLAQNPLLHFAFETLREDLLHAAARAGWADPSAAVQTIAAKMALEKLLDRHPHDLSGGERQLGALAMLLLGRPQLLLLDEPTKGMDASAKSRLLGHLDEIGRDGASFVVATHDLDFAAAFANRCALLFQGQIVADDEPEAFFEGNLFYATPLHRLLHRLHAAGNTGSRFPEGAVR